MLSGKKVTRGSISIKQRVKKKYAENEFQEYEFQKSVADYAKTKCAEREVQKQELLQKASKGALQTLARSFQSGKEVKTKKRSPVIFRHG